MAVKILKKKESVKNINADGHATSWLNQIIRRGHKLGRFGRFMGNLGHHGLSYFFFDWNPRVRNIFYITT